ncbi:hypothetical protein [Microvirga massiliensis]|uniref:hypothetical protein n=1 Tax=Microvirga massiliensis TaxID=1033741 RepID=UPI00062BD8EC|nr:hypothetical protein [Microvirga massiliensis]
MPEFILDEILMAERKPECRPVDVAYYCMLDQLFRPATVRKAGGKAPDAMDGAIGSAEQKRVGIQRDQAPVQ